MPMLESFQFRHADVVRSGRLDAMTDVAALLEEYYARVDGARPGDPLELIAADPEVAFNVPGVDVRSRAQLEDYVAQRDASRTHRLNEVHAFGRCALALGESLRGTEVLGTFVAAVEVDDEGRFTRYLVTFEPGMRFST